MHHIIRTWLKIKALSADCAPHMAFILEDCRGSALHSLALSPRIVINGVKHQSLSWTGGFHLNLPELCRYFNCYCSR